MSLGPFDLTGKTFLTLYITLLFVTIFASAIIARRLRPEGRDGGRLDANALAYLAGGRHRFTDGVVAAMLAAGALRIERRKHLIVDRRACPTDATQRALLALRDPATIGDAERALASEAAATEDRLVRAGLLIEPGEAWAIGLWQTLPYLLLFGFGAIKWEIGTLRERPVGYLTALLIVTFVLGLIRFAKVDRRTCGGLARLGRERAGWDRLRRGAVRDETGLAVALFGTGVLSGSAYADYHTLRSASGDGGASDSGGGGGCGGGGGGCGGCGG